MDVVLLARLQFAITIIYHFFFVPLTLGLSLVVAILETTYVITGKEKYKRLTKFWGKLFLINFSIGVVTGIVQEFQFGMSWSEYSRFVGDVFGAPLAIEGLTSFFLESVFLGLWIFSWDKISKELHAAAIWLVAIGSNLSALWILIANMWMQHPVGYAVIDGRAVLTDFLKVIFNFLIFTHFPHVISAGLVTVAFFMLGISSYHLVRHNETELFRISFRMAAIIGVIGTITVGIFGHAQGQQIPHYQPMKLASLEALYDTENPAALSIVRIENPFTDTVILDIRIPALLSFMTFNRFSGEVQGIYDLQKQYVEQFGPGDYIPPPFILYWSFRSMVGLGLIMILISLFALFVDLRNLYGKVPWFLKLLPLTIVLPYLANTTGWILTEVGRFPWVVYGLVKLQDGVSVVVKSGTLLTSLIGFILVYGILISVTLYLMFKYAKAGPLETVEAPADITPSLINPPEPQEEA